MGLEIRPKGDNKIEISGTGVELDSVYARVSWLVPEDGKTMELAYSIYANERMFKEGKPLPTSIPLNTVRAGLDPAVDTQDYATAMKYVKEAFDKMGYDSEVVRERKVESEE